MKSLDSSSVDDAAAQSRKSARTTMRAVHDLRLRSLRHTGAVGEVKARDRDGAGRASAARDACDARGEAEPFISVAICADSEEDRSALTLLLTAHRCAVYAAACAGEFVVQAQRRPFDLLVLGWEADSTKEMGMLRTLRRSIATPILIATRRADEIDAVRAFQAGADSYVIKPWRPLELVARIRALVRTSRWRVRA